MSRVSTVVGSSLCLLSLLGSAQSLQLTEKMQLFFFFLVMEAEAGLGPAACQIAPDSAANLKPTLGAKAEETTG